MAVTRMGIGHAQNLLNIKAKYPDVFERDCGLLSNGYQALSAPN
ncbi:hypothetical protein SAMN04515620_10974 [Collimonas sp. OK607]|nr:hypothetical protein SAMN04515620_10974 [Collimonas sp. OK607]